MIFSLSPHMIEALKFYYDCEYGGAWRSDADSKILKQTSFALHRRGLIVADRAMPRTPRDFTITDNGVSLFRIIRSL